MNWDTTDGCVSSTVWHISELWDPFLWTLAVDPFGAVRCACGFFTCWALVLHIITPRTPRGGAFRLLLAVVVSIGGAYILGGQNCPFWQEFRIQNGQIWSSKYIVYWHPRQLHIKTFERGIEFNLRGPALWLVDVLFHHLPLLVVILTTTSLHRSGSVTALGTHACVLLSFAVFVATGHDPRRVYGLRGTDLIRLVTVTTFAVIAISVLSHRIEPTQQ